MMTVENSTRDCLQFPQGLVFTTRLLEELLAGLFIQTFPTVSWKLDSFLMFKTEDAEKKTLDVSEKCVARFFFLVSRLCELFWFRFYFFISLHPTLGGWSVTTEGVCIRCPVQSTGQTSERSFHVKKKKKDRNNGKMS